MRINFVILLVFLASAASAQWLQTNGPEGGYTSHLTKISGGLFVNGQAGGIFRSTDGGLTWSAVNNGLPTYSHCYYLTSFQDKLYAAVYDDGIFFSDDFGEHWNAINTGIEDVTVYALAVNGDEIFAGNANGGFYFSPDHGASWTAHEGALKSVAVRTFVISGNKVFAAVNGTDKTGVYLSEDKGMTWTKLGVTSSHINAMAGYDNALYVSDGALKISRDYGVSWTEAIPSPSRYVMGAIEAVGDRVSIGGSSKAIFYSDDEGKTWISRLESGPDNHHTSILSEGTKFWLATANGMYYSEDGGETWQGRNNGMRNQIIERMYAHGDTLFAVGTSAGLFTSPDAGTSWAQAMVTTPDWGTTVVTGFHATDRYKIVSTFQGTFTTPSINEPWTELTLPDGNHLISTLAGDDDRIMGAVYRQGVYVSVDEGDTWTFKPADVFGENGLTCSAIKGDTIVIGTGEGLFISKDFGDTWAASSTPPTYFSPRAILLNDSSLTVVASLGIFQSMDLGATWGRMDDLPAGVYPDEMVIAANGNYYAATHGGVYVSFNKGTNWFPVNSNLESPVASLAMVGNQLFAGTFGRGVWVSPIDQLNVRPSVGQQTTAFTITDEETIALTPGDFQITDPDNETLTLVIKEGENYTVNDNVITPRPGFVGDLTIPIQIHDGFQLSDVFNATVRVVRIVGTEESASNLQVYPNPASESIFIEHANGAALHLVLMDHFGKVIRQETGYNSNTVPIDVSSLSAGLYLLKIKTGTESRTVRFSKK